MKHGLNGAAQVSIYVGGKLSVQVSSLVLPARAFFLSCRPISDSCTDFAVDDLVGEHVAPHAAFVFAIGIVILFIVRGTARSIVLALPCVRVVWASRNWMKMERSSALGGGKAFPDRSWVPIDACLVMH